MTKEASPCYLWHPLLRDGGVLVLSTYDKYSDGVSARDTLTATRVLSGLVSHNPRNPIKVRVPRVFQSEDWNNHLVLIGGRLSNQLTRTIEDSSLHKLRGSLGLQSEMLSDTELPPGQNCLSPVYVPGLETNMIGVKSDYGLVSVQTNPLNKVSKLYLIAGIKGWGTLAAGTVFSSPEHYRALNLIFQKHFGMSADEIDHCSLVEVIVHTEVGHTGEQGTRDIKDISIELVRISGDPQTQWISSDSRLPWGPKPPLKVRSGSTAGRFSLSMNERMVTTELGGTGFAVRFAESHLTSNELDQFEFDVESTLVRPDWRTGAKIISERLCSVLPDSFSELLSRMQLMVAPPERSWVRFVTPREYIRAPFEFLRTERDYLVLEYPVFRAISNSFCVRSGLSVSLIEELRLADKPLRVLLVASDPLGNIIQDVNREIETIAQVLEMANRWTRDLRIEVDVIRAEHATIDRMKQILPKSPFHILHYAGHSRWHREENPEKGGLLFQSGTRQVVLSANQLAAWMRDSELRFCFMSSCESSRSAGEQQLLSYDILGLADSLIQASVPEVLGYRWSVSSKSAVRLAETFYKALLSEASFSTELALFRARQRIAEQNRDDSTWLSPILISQK